MAIFTGNVHIRGLKSSFVKLILAWHRWMMPENVIFCLEMVVLIEQEADDC